MPKNFRQTPPLDKYCALLPISAIKWQQVGFFNLFSHYSISPVVTLPHSSPIRPSVSEEDAPQGHLVVSLVVVPEPMVSHIVVSHTLGMPFFTNISGFF